MNNFALEEKCPLSTFKSAFSNFAFYVINIVIVIGIAIGIAIGIGIGIGNGKQFAAHALKIYITQGRMRNL